MDASTENLAEHDMPEETANSNIQSQGLDDELGTGVGEKRWPGWPGDNVFRILVPSQKVGSIIGRKGELIKRMCEESKARIKILDGPPNALERAVIISAKEEPDALVSPAMDALLRVHRRIVGGLDGEGAHAPPNGGPHLPTRLLVGATHAGTLIGKQGATIKSIQEASKSNVRVVEELPPVALKDDKVVEIQGEPEAMHKAVELVANILRKYLVDRSVLPIFEMHLSMQQPEQHMHHQQHMEQHPHMEQQMHHRHMEQRMHHDMPPPQPWGHRHAPLNAGGPGYGPPRTQDNFYPPPDFPVEKPPHHGISQYGREAPPFGGHPSINQPPHVSSQVTHHMQIPLLYADAVIGSSGGNISYIRRTSGATISIQESRGVSGEMTVEINGSATQIQIAQQLIQNSMAGAGAPAPDVVQNKIPPAEHGYGSYEAYASSGNGGAPAHSGGGYPPVYGTNYGY